MSTKGSHKRPCQVSMRESDDNYERAFGVFVPSKYCDRCKQTYKPTKKHICIPPKTNCKN